jgi:hypothetical protein
MNLTSVELRFQKDYLIDVAQLSCQAAVLQVIPRFNLCNASQSSSSSVRNFQKATVISSKSDVSLLMASEVP